MVYSSAIHKVVTSMHFKSIGALQLMYMLALTLLSFTKRLCFCCKYCVFSYRINMISTSYDYESYLF